MSVAFWSAKLSNDGKGVDVQPPENFVLIVTNAALDLEGNNKGSVAVKLTTESIEGEKISSILGTLNPEKFPQFTLNVCLGYDVETIFTVVGPKDSKATVHLSGYYQPAPDNEGDGMDEFDEEDFDEEDFDEEEEDEESEEEESPVAVKPAITNGKKVETKAVEVKKNGAKAPSKRDADSDDEEVNAKTIARMVKEAQVAAMEEDDESEEDDDEDDSEEDDEDDEGEESDDDSEDMPPLKVQKTQPQGFSKPKNNNNNKTPNKPNNNAPKTPQTGNKPAPQSGSKNSNINKTPNAQQNKTPNAQQNKTPQTGNKNHNNNNNSGFKSGDKRKR